jgi:uncharacterized phage protein (TIGR02218 family)
MSRNIPTPIRLDLSSNASTLTRVLRILLVDGTSYGICMSNRDVTYDHGDGAVTYVATNGFDPTTFSADVGYSVDNAEGYALISNDIPGVTQAMVNAGALDGAQWICYYVNYVTPITGSAVILDAGDVGQVRVQYGMLWIPELLSYIVRLTQNVGDVYSRTCRAEFGTYAAQQRGCGINADALWQNFTVTAVGAENDRTFDTAGLDDSAHPFYPGRIQWLTGASAGKLVAVESFDIDSSGAQTVSMMETLPYPIVVGDTGRIRPDCDKTKTNCDAYDNFLNMKAETLIPVGDTASIQIPGAQL